MVPIIISSDGFFSLNLICIKKIKYEISSDLPSVRARRFESDERDLSPASLAIGCPVLEK